MQHAQLQLLQMKKIRQLWIIQLAKTTAIRRLTTKNNIKYERITWAKNKIIRFKIANLDSDNVKNAFGLLRMMKYCQSQTMTAT